MDRGDTTAEVLNGGLPSPFPSHYGDNRSAEPDAQHQQPAVHAYSQADQQRQTYALAATPTSDHSGYPASARSGSFPQNYVAGSMAQHSSSLNLQDEAVAAHPEPHDDAQQLKSDPDVPIDPSMQAQQSPTQYAGYSQQMYGHADHGQQYGHQAGWSQPRPDWAGYSQHTPITPNHVFHQQTTPTGARAGGNQVFSFVPIPGSQQHKRPRRRYEEIERMYKCGWHGCEKAYGTLNHLNAHVTMQSHGAKRVPDEFKEIRKEWKQRKKAQEASRKQQDDVAHGDGQTATPAESQTGHDTQQSYGTSRNLPPLPYNPASFPNAPQFSNSSSAEGYSSNYVTGNQGYPTSPYAQSHQAVYSTANGGQPH